MKISEAILKRCSIRKGKDKGVNLCFMVVGIITIYMFFSSARYCYCGEKLYADGSISEADLLSLIGNVPAAYPRIELGKEFYDRWTRPALPFPWELSMEEREKLSAREVLDRYFLGFISFGQFSKSMIEVAGIHLIGPTGSVRSKSVRYWHRHYLKDRTEDVLFKSLYVYDYPKDMKETAILTYVYKDRDRPDDTWLYTPTVRKVRRLSNVSKQDDLTGSIFKGDDTVPNWNMYSIRFLRSEIFENPGAHIIGESEEILKRRVNGIGDDCWVIELIPRQKDWYYKKELVWVSKKTFAAYLFKKYDEKGRLIFTFIPGIYHAIECNNLYGAKDYNICWAVSWTQDHKTNFKSLFAVKEQHFDQETFPEDFLTQETLTKQPAGLFR